jgi:alpha-L-fucosidase
MANQKVCAQHARYIKLGVLSNTEGNDNTGYAEIDVISK